MNRRLLVALCAVLAVALIVVVVLKNLTDAEPTVLDASDIGGFEDVLHNTEGARAPGATSCYEMDTYNFHGRLVATSRLSRGDPNRDYATVGATLIDGEDAGHSVDEGIEHIEVQARFCADEAERDDSAASVRPLTGLDEDAIGWRTEDLNGLWGNFVVIKLDEWRVLAVGFETTEAEPPIELDELIRLALEGVERVGLDD